MSNKRNANEFERRNETQIKMQGKSSKNGFETHTNTEEEENLPLRAS